MKLLLTVIRPAEVSTALEAGADLLDAKDPARGSLGRPGPDALEGIARACGGRRPLSVALGDGPHDPDALRRSVTRALRVRPAYLKVGLARPGPTDHDGRPSPGPVRALRAARDVLDRAGSRARLVAVTFADAAPGRAPSLRRLVEVAGRAGADGVMVDTLSKGSAGALDLLGRPRLRAWGERAAGRGLETALAGGLDAAALRRVAGVGLDVVGVRGGACGGGERAGRLDPGRCRAIRRAVDAGTPRPRRRPGRSRAG